ncbi:probable tRNA (uracil-O(2)-)-methyltransferase [Euwallacea fornicatus]|uniref:probable tRNA (uracil-O(2)-)-methyltransferase n=1 Tax=Euwallacea fornicatus TaxID=995702 RepID=UPI00338F1C55
MFPIPLAMSSTTIPLEKFWDAVFLYFNRPHLINRKIITTSVNSYFEVRFDSNGLKLHELINRAAVLYEARNFRNISADDIKKNFLKNLLYCYDNNLELNDVSFENVKIAHKGTFLCTRILFPRIKNSPNAIEIVILDKEYNKATFLAVTDSERVLIAPSCPYEIELTNSSNLRVNVPTFEDADTAHAQWLADKLFSKLVKWAAEDLNEGKIHSLSLINSEEYCFMYNRLKECYGVTLVQDWPKKSGTDPQKYVFEDIAIASYLMCLWKNEKDVNFVDCGCGNGLLVHLLNKEGYNGYGIDVRARPTWDLYDKSTILQVDTIGPESTFPSATWLIGNHSDELTPWIPVVALKSEANFFVLPCCPYDFNGQKHIRKNTSISAYADYLTYIEDISKYCGFELAIDKLRIPSTKRTCLIGRRKRMCTNDRDNTLKRVTDLVESKISKKFVQKSGIERVRNCTQLDQNLVSDIIAICIRTLLSHENNIQKGNGELWNLGGSVKISNLIQEIPKNLLRQLKQECGGLQTILRNHRYLFEMQNGLVTMRVPVNIKESVKYKEKNCWFEKNHPQGCLYDKQNCGYKHK